MSILSGKKILLGITAGIAAYKTANLVRLFIKSGAEVQVIMTPASKILLHHLPYLHFLKTQFTQPFTKRKKKMNCGIIM